MMNWIESEIIFNFPTIFLVDDIKNFLMNININRLYGFDDKSLGILGQKEHRSSINIRV